MSRFFRLSERLTKFYAERLTVVESYVPRRRLATLPEDSTTRARHASLRRVVSSWRLVIRLSVRRSRS